jgi:hypothetical protein
MNVKAEKICRKRKSCLSALGNKLRQGLLVHFFSASDGAATWVGFQERKIDGLNLVIFIFQPCKEMEEVSKC